MTSLTKRALLIGTEHYQYGGLSDLPCTRADTQALKQVLEHPSIGAFDSVEVVHDADSTMVRQRLVDFFEAAGEQEQVVLFLSGHGTSSLSGDGRFFFATSDTDPSRLEDTAISSEFVNEQLEQCSAVQKIAVLDCCESGGFTAGFTSRPRQAKSVKGPLLRSRGVYVLSSSSAEESSFAGLFDADGNPTPSLFTGALVDALATGKGDRDGDGDVGVDELFRYVSEQVRARHNGQNPEKSSLAVSDEIVLARAYRGPALRLQPPVAASRLAAHDTSHQVSMAVSASGTDDPWAVLIDYYRSCLLADAVEPDLLRVDELGRKFVCVPGVERVLTGDLDEGGTCDLPPNTAALLDQVAKDDADLWYGYPAVVLLEDANGKSLRTPEVAPLFVRRVAIVESPSGQRLEPYGAVEPHRVLARRLLGDEEAENLVGTYTASWHAGSHSQLLKDVNHHLVDPFELRSVHELHPLALDAELDLQTPVSGARNVALLFAVPRDIRATVGLLKDLDYIKEKAASIDGTALEHLLRSPQAASSSTPWTPVLPLATNEAQRAVIEAAMTRTLTVATGPPGTGKSQLVANLVATAVANGQSVLVASTNNQAVDEVVNRCGAVVKGSVVRTGSRNKIDYRQMESTTLTELVGAPASRSTIPTLRAELRHALAVSEDMEARFGGKAELELTLLGLGQRRESAVAQWCAAGGAADLPAELDLPGWVSRARALAHARFLGRWRRGRHLRRIGWTGDPSTAMCALAADRVDAEHAWRSARPLADEQWSDDDLSARRHDADTRVRAASTALLGAVVADGARAGGRAVAELQRATGGDWHELRRVLPHIRGWAVTSLSVRRFPTDPRLFDLVVLDEASQCLIPHVLPLMFRAKRALIIGDPMQLPPVTKVRPEVEKGARRSSGARTVWLEEHRMTYHRHSAFHAFEHAAGDSLLLDEHFRCHPHIADIPNHRFYGGRLTVLTAVQQQKRMPDKAAVIWVDVQGVATQTTAASSGRSWRNQAEVDTVVRCVRQLGEMLPADATIGVVTPFTGQKGLLEETFRGAERVRVGTVHTFQGGECDAVVLTLVASKEMTSGSVNWLERQAFLWNVAITRARAHLLVVGDRRLWTGRGGIGAQLVSAAEMSSSFEAESEDPLLSRLYDLARAVPDTSTELSVPFDGYRADAVVTRGSGSRAVLLDRGAGVASMPHHLRLSLARTRLLGDEANEREAVRLPAWRLFDDVAFTGFVSSGDRVQDGQ